MKRWMLLLCAGCMPSVVPDKTGSPGLSDTASVLDTAAPETMQRMAVIATLADDYSVGALATVDLATLQVLDTLAPTSGDAVVRVAGDEVVVLNRLNTDTLRLYTAGEWAAPTLELALPDLSNPQNAQWCGGKLWVSLHNSASMPAYDRTGLRVDQADLSVWSGSDGAAEALGLHAYGGFLYAALEQFAQDDRWSSEGGAVVRIDCETAQVTEVLSAEPSPAISSGPTQGSLLVRTGLYGDLDGSVHLLDLKTGETELLLTEESVGADITAVEIYGDSLVYLTATDDWVYSVICRDLSTGEETIGLSTYSFLSDLKIDDRGRAWVAARAGWGGEEDAVPGLHILDVARCDSILSEPIRTTLKPYLVSML
jgi:hypothetical protein